MKPYTEDATCPKCETRYHAHVATPKYCDGLDCPVLHAKTETIRHGSEITAIKRIPPPEHLHCTCENCGYEWLMECADTKEPMRDHPWLTCPACDAILTILSEHSERIHVVYRKPKDAEGCTCNSVIASIQGLHLKDCPEYNTKKEQDDPTEGCTCVGGDWHFEDCPQYQP